MSKTSKDAQQNRIPSWQCAFGMDPSALTFHAHQPWQDQIVYVPITLLASCHRGLGENIQTSKGTKTLNTQMLLEMWRGPSMDAPADAYIWFPMSVDQMGIKEGKQCVPTLLQWVCQKEQGTLEPEKQKVLQAIESGVSGGVRIGTDGSEYLSGMFDKKALWDLVCAHAQHYHLSVQLKETKNVPVGVHQRVKNKMSL